MFLNFVDSPSLLDYSPGVRGVGVGGAGFLILSLSDSILTTGLGTRDAQAQVFSIPGILPNLSPSPEPANSSLSREPDLGAP